MLRLRIDLTAFEAKPKGIFWRLERNGILHETVQKYTAHLLQEYGITGVKPMTFLDGTFLPESESPLIFQNGDLLRILPDRLFGTNVVASSRKAPETSSIPAPNATAVIESFEHPHSNGEATKHPQQETGTIDCVIESTEETEVLDETDISEINGKIPKKRKRGKRQTRVRSKRVSFDVLADETGREDATPQLESTPFRKRVAGDTVEETQNGASVDTRSEAYTTAIDVTPGISKQSRPQMKAGSVRKERKLQAGVGYYLGLLGSGDNSVIAASSVNSGASPVNNHSTPGPSNVGGSQYDDESLRNTPERNKKDGSLLSTLTPNAKISCDLGMFNVKTSGLERYPDVTLEILKNNTDKKSFTVRHIEGSLPSHASGNEFKVDWSMMSSVNIL